MHRSLIIAPGVGSPRHPRYSDVYKTLANGSTKRGFHHVEILTYPGHDPETANELSFESSKAVVATAILKHRQQGWNPTLLARSYGCYAAAGALADPEGELAVDSLVLWGPPPYWLMYEFWQNDLDVEIKEIGTTRRAQAADKFARVGPSFFSSLVPLEFSLPRVLSEKRFRRLVLATGEKDPYCPPTFLSYLGSLLDLSELPVVEGVGHEVACGLDPPHAVASYLRVLLGPPVEAP